jgi:feruloyl esterase
MIPRATAVVTALSGLVQGALASRTASCSKSTFKSLDLKGIKITSLDVTPAHNYSTSGRNATGGVGVIPDIPGSPAPTVDICFITITYTHHGQKDVVSAYIGLPLNANDWNSQFLMDGGGAWYAGGQPEVLSPVLAGYASSSTDGGHGVTASTGDWALTKKGDINWPNVWDFSSVAIAEAAILGKMATKVYYGSEPKYSYWHGCSTGGRQGHAMAQQYPELFDGIVGGAPAVNWDKFAPAGFWGPLKAQLLGKSWIFSFDVESCHFFFFNGILRYSHPSFTLLHLPFILASSLYHLLTGTQMFGHLFVSSRRLPTRLSQPAMSSTE